MRPELSWSHYRLLIRIEEKPIRDFYICESINQHWSTRKLDRNISSQYYHRIIANQVEKSKDASEKIITNLSYIKNPYVLEFLDLPTHILPKEKDLEKAIISQLQIFTGIRKRLCICCAAKINSN